MVKRQREESSTDVDASTSTSTSIIFPDNKRIRSYDTKYKNVFNNEFIPAFLQKQEVEVKIKIPISAMHFLIFDSVEANTTKKLLELGANIANIDCIEKNSYTADKLNSLGVTVYQGNAEEVLQSPSQHPYHVLIFDMNGSPLSIAKCIILAINNGYLAETCLLITTCSYRIGKIGGSFELHDKTFKALLYDVLFTHNFALQQLSDPILLTINNHRYDSSDPSYSYGNPFSGQANMKNMCFLITQASINSEHDEFYLSDAEKSEIVRLIYRLEKSKYYYLTQYINNLETFDSLRREIKTLFQTMRQEIKTIIKTLFQPMRQEIKTLFQPMRQQFIMKV